VLNSFISPHAFPEQLQRPRFHIFEHWTVDVKKKISILLVQIIKRCGTVQKKYLNSQEIPANSSSSLHDKVIFQFILCYYEPSPNKLKATPNDVDLAMDLLLSRPINTGENQPITNLKQRISSTTTFTTKKT